jgi:hypothetical protein
MRLCVYSSQPSFLRIKSSAFALRSARRNSFHVDGTSADVRRAFTSGLSLRTIFPAKRRCDCKTALSLIFEERVFYSHDKALRRDGFTLRGKREGWAATGPCDLMGGRGHSAYQSYSDSTCEGKRLHGRVGEGDGDGGGSRAGEPTSARKAGRRVLAGGEC